MKINIVLRFSNKYNNNLKYQTNSFCFKLGNELTFVLFENNNYVILSGCKVNNRLKNKYGDLVCTPMDELTFSYKLV